MNKVPPGTTNFPDAVVRFEPDLFEMCDQGPLQVPGSFELLHAAAARLVKRIEDLAIHIELELLRGGIADAERAGTFIAGQLRQFKFR